MGRAREDKLRHAKLSNTSKALKLGQMEQTPGELIESVFGPKGNQRVNGISNALVTYHFENILRTLACANPFSICR